MIRAIHGWLRRLAPERPRRSARQTPPEMMHYWINPELASERACWMRSEFARTGLRNRRVAACTPSALPPLLLPAGREATPLQVACLCSHFAALEQGVELGDDMFMVMEDDMMLPFEIDFERLLQRAPDDWGILQFYIVNADRLHAMYARSYRRGRLWERWQTKNHSTGAYVCSRDTAQALLARFKPDGILDLSTYKGLPIADELLYRTVPTYSATYPLYIENDSFDSTVNSLRRLHLASHAVVRDIWSEGAPPDFATRHTAREQV